MRKIPRLLPLIAVAIGGVVIVRAVGIAPGLFEGAQAWAEEAVPAAAAAAVKPAAAVCALTPEQLAQQAGISPAELRILQSLQSRRTQLDARNTDLASMLPLMATAEQKLDARVQALEAVKAEVQQLLGQVSEQEKAENDRLVAVYTAMRPKEAARVFATLSDDVRLPVAAAMRPRSLAAVMAQMEPAAARELTEKLARRFAARQQLAARAATAATANAPAPGQVAVPTANAAPSAAATATPPAQTSAAAPATATPTPRPAVRRTPSRPASRPAAPTPRPTPAPAAAAPSAPQPYQAGEAAPAAPRQSVQ